MLLMRRTPNNLQNGLRNAFFCMNHIHLLMVLRKIRTFFLTFNPTEKFVQFYKKLSVQMSKISKTFFILQSNKTGVTILPRDFFAETKFSAINKIGEISLDVDWTSHSGQITFDQNDTCPFVQYFKKKD